MRVCGCVDDLQYICVCVCLVVCISALVGGCCGCRGGVYTVSYAGIAREKKEDE